MCSQSSGQFGFNQPSLIYLLGFDDLKRELVCCRREALMPGKQEILRALKTLPEESLKDIEEFIKSLKKHNGKRGASGLDQKSLAKKQVFAIKKWAGATLEAGFSGREHDAILYRKDS